MARALPTPPSLPTSAPAPATPPRPVAATLLRPALPTPPTANTCSPGSFSKKRNFKLQLPAPPLSIPSPPTSSLPLPPLPTRNAPGQPPRPKHILSIDIQNAQPHNTGLTLSSNQGPFGRGAVGLSSGLPPISASVLMTPESSTTQRQNLQAALTTALEQMQVNERRPALSSSSSSMTLTSGGLASDGSSISIASSISTATTAESADCRSLSDRDRVLNTGPLQECELRNLAELGMGNGGSVMKVEHVPSGVIMAKKIVLIDAKPSVRKQILRELHIMHSCSSPYIVSSFGAFISEPNICICMEFMDKGSFDSIYKSIGRYKSNAQRTSGVEESTEGPIPICIVRQAVKRVLGGLVYLYEAMGVLHRDIKPSNILLNSEGQVKLCDFGVSGELENSVAKTFVGTSVYMSPERIQGSDYSIKSDVWSLGITLIELAHGCFPFSDTEVDESPSDSAAPSATLSLTRRSQRKSKGVSVHGGVGTLSILELMHHIVREPPPVLITPSIPHSKDFAGEAAQFVDYCLRKDPNERPSPRELLGMSWMDDEGRDEEMDLRKWAVTL
ncbi:kinase-like domain-containing protein [Lentinula aciculospora]|uniref:Kinase-like domain-containing protein n=1 Tax=Lentinula aciculospora TaxID=153920 RepID=A0A9W9A6K6_9AGAR|nr:kinase-like domain-containing protein [Lentinula aciculospora]